MIKTIIKRDGRREPFTPKKINGWGVWGAKTLGGKVDWASAVLHVCSTLGEVATSEELQNGLIDYCLSQRTWEYNRMAGRLYSALLSRIIYGTGGRPTIKEVHEKAFQAGLMVRLNYSDAEYAEAEGFIRHDRDLKMAHYQIHQIRKKYSLQNKVTGAEFETAQFVYMRMAMALSENEPTGDRMGIVKGFYDLFSQHKINAPTPNFTNLGTSLNGFASCCLYTTDDTWRSLAAGDHIACSMTALSAGIGTHIRTRSEGDPIRGGAIVHKGKIMYYRSLVGAIGANTQNGRGGSSTVYYTCFDPEVTKIQAMKNPMTPATRQVRGIDYNFGSNRFFARKVMRDEQVSLFSYYGNEALYEAQYAKDQDLFPKLYQEFLDDPTKEKMWVSAREVFLGAETEANETGRHYLHNFDEMNRHTPFKDPIYSSNLCAEIAEPTKPYASVAQLYQPWDETHGEIALCSLGGIIVSNITSDEEYAMAAYYTLKMIDYCILNSHYEFKSLEDSAKARMNAGVGVLGLAHLMAKKNIKYGTQESRNFIHEQFETHMWHLVNASLKISKERGVAKWMHKTLWPTGWTPISTYNKNVDELVTVEPKRDWNGFSLAAIENGGIGHSVLCAHMPGESSTIAAGTTNSMYPIRDYDLSKTNDTLNVDWVAPDSTDLRDNYTIAWDVAPNDMMMDYAVAQKWTDQAISADIWQRVQGTTVVTTEDLIGRYRVMVKYGVKTRYYLNSLTGKNVSLDAVHEPGVPDVPDAMPEESVKGDDYCEACSL